MKRWTSPLAVVLLLVCASPCFADEPSSIDGGDCAWMLMSSALVMLMIPGLALFYGGMVRRKNVLATMMHSMVALSVVGVFWVAVGYSLAFGPPLIGAPGSSFLGWSDRLFFLQGVNPLDPLPGTKIPIYLHVMFQGMFAIITPALISGALAERIRFKPYCIFLILWTTLVYCPLAHWVWALDWWTPIPASRARRPSAGSAPPTRSTSPAGPSFTSRPGFPAWRPSWCCANASATPNTSFTPTAWC